MLDISEDLENILYEMDGEGEFHHLVTKSLMYGAKENKSIGPFNLIYSLIFLYHLVKSVSPECPWLSTRKHMVELGTIMAIDPDNPPNRVERYKIEKSTEYYLEREITR